MTDERRLTTDRFYGGTSRRIELLEEFLTFVEVRRPPRAKSMDWILSNTQAESRDAINHHLPFLETIDLIELSDEEVRIGDRGWQYLDAQTPEVLFEALRANVSGFEMILREMETNPLTDKDIMDLLVAEFEDMNMEAPGVAARHREWLQVLGYVERTDGGNRLTKDGRELASNLDRDGAARGRPFEVGKTYKRTELHDEYGGIRYSDIAPCSDYPFVLIFTGESGKEYGYEDEFLEDGTFLYTGEGQEGDMTWDHGNRAIRDHEDEDRQLHLFESHDDGYVTYVGQYEYEGSKREELRDANGEIRDAIRFRLVPAGGREIDIETDDPDELSEEELYQKAKESVQNSGGSGGSGGSGVGSGGSTTTTSTRTSYSRSELPRRYALRVADGVCQGCGEPAPFQDENGEPFLEVHHLHRRSDGGADHPDNVIAICPNCHRRVHHGQDKDEFNQQLIETVEQRNIEGI